MKKSLTLFAALALLAGCQFAEITPTIPKESKTFEGVIINDTRADLIADGDVWHVIWAEGEKISINGIIYKATVGDVSSTYFVRDALNYESDADSPYTAYSPSYIAAGLPAVQNYVPGNVAYVPMMATSDTELLPFKNLTSILKINITTGESGAAVKRLELKADQGLSGEFQVEGDAAVVSGTAGLTLNCGDGVAIGADPVPFFVAVPAGTYTNLSITAVLMDGRSQTLKLKAASSITTERSKVHEGTLAFNSFSASPAVDGKAILMPGPEFNAAIKGLVVPGALRDDEDVMIKRIVLSVCDPSEEGIVVSDASSPVPVYASLEPTSGVVTIATAAKEIATGEDASSLFYRFMALEGFDNLRALNTEAAVNMSYMFSQMTPTDTSMLALKSIDLSNFNTENCVDMGSMFNSVRAMEHLDVSTFNTSNVENMRYMFGNCRHLLELDLSNFDFSKDTSMAYMFYYNEHLKSVKFADDINTSNVENMRDMFYNNASLTSLDVSKFDTSSCNDMAYMFEYCGQLEKLDISNFDFTNDSTMNYMFAYDSALVELILPEKIACDNMLILNSAFRKVHCFYEFDMDVFEDADNVLGMRFMLAYNKNLRKVTSKNNGWDETDPYALFGYASEEAGTLDVSEFDTSSMTNFRYFFYRNLASTLDLRNWDTSNATNIQYMFFQCKNLANLYLGEDFYWETAPSNTCFFAGTADKTSGEQTGSVPGAITIWCTPDTARAVSKILTVKYVHTGNYTGIETPITFRDLKTGTVIPVTWE